ncbi:hypothetical protein NMX13_02010 [Dickeya zeae]|nr:hypothetical protein NMX13_02010 [Dickeya zeae]
MIFDKIKKCPLYIMIFDKINKYPLYIMIFIFLVGNVFFTAKDFPFKKSICVFFLILTLVSFVFFRKNVREVVDFHSRLEGGNYEKISAIVSLLSWVVFSLSIFFINVGFIVIARWLMLPFAIFVIVSGALTFYALERDGNKVIIKVKSLFFAGVSLLYFITAAYAESYFLQASNMDLNTSPLLAFWWKLDFFIIYFFMVLQPISYIIFILISKELTTHRLMVFFGVLMLTAMLLNGAPRWANNSIVLFLDWTTSSEWRSFATCGHLNISDPRERYFGFNTEKYNVYFSNREGQWGFEEIKCTKDDEGQDSFTRVLVSQSDMPKWFKE